MMITTTDLSYQYDKDNAFRFPDISCGSGEKLLILGRSGIGKSTLLNLLGGLMPAQSGGITIDGTEISGLGSAGLDKFRGKNIGIIFQKSHFIESISVLENLLLTQKLAKAKVSASDCRELLRELNIEDKADSKIKNLSEGEKQRVSIARAIVNQPKLILADEPTSALDDDNCQKVIDLLDRQAKKIGAALLIVTHDNRLKDIIDNKIILS